MSPSHSLHRAFYASIEPVEDFEELASQKSYVPLPAGWSIVAADISGSTRAIEEGRYKAVNTVGVSVIAAVRNVLRPTEIPYVFGGDGAVLCVPDDAVDAVRAALAATVAMARESFGLTLLAAVVSVDVVRERGLDVLVARHRASEHYVQCALFGGGAEYVERALKDQELPPELVVAGDAGAPADYTGLECRWSEIPSPAAETVALIVEVNGDEESRLRTLRRVMDATRRAYGDADQCRPVVEEGLRVALSGETLSNETRLKHWRSPATARALAAVRLRLATLLGWLLFRIGVRTKSTDWGRYKRDLVANTDFRKFDGSLRLVLAGTEAQRTELERFLESARDRGELAYGIHVARSALMTCLIDQRQGSHFHFVDAAGGGYAAAALSLKRG